MKLLSASFRNKMLVGLLSAAAFATAFAGEVQAKKIVITQTSIYVSTLPKGCVKTMYGNVTVWRCGTIYYQPYKGRYVRVYIN